MKVFPRTLSFVVLVFALTGICFSQTQPPSAEQSAAPNTPKPAEPDPKPEVRPPDPSANSLIYFYRLKAFVGWALEPLIVCDNKEVAKMDNGSYFAISLPPGKHTCNISNNKSGFEADIKAGETRHAKITLEAGAWKGHGVITLVQPEQASYEIKSLKLLKASKIRNHDLVTIYEGAPK